MSFRTPISRLFFGLLSGRVNIGFHLHNFCIVLFSGIRCKWPNKLYFVLLGDLLYS